MVYILVLSVLMDCNKHICNREGCRVSASFGLSRANLSWFYDLPTGIKGITKCCYGVPTIPRSPFNDYCTSVWPCRLNSSVELQLANCTGNPRFVFDTYRRFLQMYGSVVLGVDKDRYQV